MSPGCRDAGLAWAEAVYDQDEYDIVALQAALSPPFAINITAIRMPV